MKTLFPISLILTSIILFFLVINPFYKDVKQLKTDVSVYRGALDNANVLKDTRDSLLEKYRNIKEEDKTRLNNFLPNTVNNIKFILEIERIANLHGMPLKNIKFDDKDLPENQVANTDDSIVIPSDEIVIEKPFGVFPIEFVTEGDYASFLSFIEDLELNLRLMDIKEISFTIPEKSTTPTPDVVINPNIYNYIVKVDTYWLK
jgi:hypothetical protein